MSAADRVAANRDALRGFEDRVAAAAAAGRDATAAAWAQIASDFAWNSPCGVVASPVIDDALERIGRRTCPRAPRGRHGGPERVLHVVTECAAVGGHSRMAWRWIARDERRVPTLALTRHRGELPGPLARALAERGGDAHAVRGHDLLARARELAALVDRADLVVLHIHPMEVAASIALADRRGRPPVLLVNHADHCFWLGPGVADVVVSTRPAAAAMAAERRGVAPGRSVLVPVPAEPLAGAPARDAARAAAGVGGDEVLMVAMASAYKLAPVDDIGFIDLVEPALATLPGARAMVIGPDDEGAWAAARARTGGRLRALGRRDDPSALMAAADLFLDAYPCSSLTAALEAAALGVPVVSYAPPRPQAATYDIDEPGLAGVHVVARTPEGYAEALRRLCGDRAARADLGARTAAAAAAMHDPAHWGRALEAAYARARELACATPEPGASPRRDAATLHEDAFLLALHEDAGMALSPAGAVMRNGDAFPCDPRRGLTIVVHCRDDWDGLARTLASAVETCDGIDDVEALVIDDASAPATAGRIAGLAGDVRVVRNERPLGAQGSWAGAMAAAHGEAVLLLTSGVVLTPGWPAPLTDALAMPGVSGAAPLVRGGSGRETCVLTSREAALSGSAVLAVPVPESVVLAAPSGTPLEAAP